MIYLIRFLLLPFSILYGVIIDIRNWCFDIGIFKSFKFPVPVISIGNITAGGTGKTPFAIYLAELLKNDYTKIAAVSRGHGRQSKGMKLVSDVYKILLDPQQSGDEPFLIASRLPGVLVVVSEKRRDAIDFLIQKYKPDLVLLDDAFQHRQVHSDVNIVLLNSKESYHSKWMLPTGYLREFRHNLKRADIIVLTNVDKPKASNQNKLLKYSENIYNCQSSINQLIDIDLGDAGKIDTISNKPVFAFAGIAHPENFKNALEKKGIYVRGFQSYADHFNFSIANLEDLLNQCNENDCQILLCTEKDLVKIARLVDVNKRLENAKIQLLSVRLKMKIEQADELVKNVCTLLDNNK